ncbi:hypothetical protein LTS10_000891 [Elasticomyces elasticus]|nr:hypothetical protein LTS10_000891 [Elasticomyces elasticus]
MALDMMDVDMDIDFGDEDADIARMQAEAAALEASGKELEADAMNGVEEVPEEGEVDVHAIVPKLHVTGVDNFGPRDVDNYAREHYADDFFNSVEWVNDSAVNLVYDTEAAAAEALQAFSAEEVADPLEFRAGKRLITHPDVELFIRRATEQDVKVKGASNFSRFYLDNPKFDPQARQAKRRFDDRGYRARDYGVKRRRPSYEDEETSRRGSQAEPWDESLYDDAPAPVVARLDRSNSYSSVEPSRKRSRITEELMPNKSNGRLRNRSASPVREGDGRFGFSEAQPRRRTARPRSPTPPERRRAATNRDAGNNLRKELFPDKRPATPTNGHSNGAMELFPNHSSPPKTPRELFPNHKRHDARDIDREYRQVEQAVSRYSLDGVEDRSIRRQPDDRQRRDSKPGGDLMSRISGGGDYGRLHDRPMPSEINGGFSIKGANGSGSTFSFKGASGRKDSENGSVKELFPMKAGGNDLFDGRIKGRGNQRRRAEDLF